MALKHTGSVALDTDEGAQLASVMGWGAAHGGVLLQGELTYQGGHLAVIGVLRGGGDDATHAKHQKKGLAHGEKDFSVNKLQNKRKISNPPNQTHFVSRFPSHLSIFSFSTSHFPFPIFHFPFPISHFFILHFSFFIFNFQFLIFFILHF